MNSRQRTSRTAWWRCFLAALAALVGLLGAGTASAATLTVAETRVGTSTPATAYAIGPHECISAVQRRDNAPPAMETTAGFGVAAKTAPGVGKALELSPWPANNGFMHEPVETALKTGTFVDRFGSDAGTFTAHVGTPLRQRAMRQGAENAPYSVFELQQNIAVWGGITAPAFSQPGGGIQYRFPTSMASLLESGAMRRLP